MSTSWLVDHCTETFRLQPALRARELKDLIDKEYSYKATLFMCSRVRAKALNAIIDDYKGQFWHIRNYLYEVYKKTLVQLVK